MQRFSLNICLVLLSGAGVLGAQTPLNQLTVRRPPLSNAAAASQLPAGANAAQTNTATPGARIAQAPGSPAVMPSGTPMPTGAGPGNPGGMPANNLPAAAPPATPPAPAELPPVPPQVTFRDGMLSVVAPNSTLGSVISAIRAKTGIEFEGAEGMIGDRIAVSVGPASEGDVLAAIFDGSRFDYVVVGRTDTPSIVQRVVLTPKIGGTAAVPATAATQNPAQPAGEDEETPDEQVSTGDPEPQDTANQPPIQQPPPTAQPQNQQPKTPEQLLQELRQMQQQQQQQKDPGAASQPNPNAPRKPPI